MRNEYLAQPIGFEGNSVSLLPLGLLANAVYNAPPGKNDSAY